jgi:hypothetical protein
MDRLLQILSEMALPFAYDHFAEGESPNPPFICYLFPGSDNFSADGRVYTKSTRLILSSTVIAKTRHWKQHWKLCLMSTAFFITKQRSGLRAKSSMKSSTHLKWRFNQHGQ